MSAIYIWCGKGWSEPKFVPSNPQSYSLGHTDQSEYQYTEKETGACTHVHFTDHTASRLESQQYKTVHTHLGQEVRNYL